MRITVMLTARADGRELKPYILLNRKRLVKELEEFCSKLVIKTEGTTWMNDSLTNFIKEVIGSTMFGCRLFVWDSSNCHNDESAKKELKRRKVDMAVVPGGCTRFVQPVDVSWNKPFKSALRVHYNEWLATGDLPKTKGGKFKHVSLKLLCGWIVKVWNSLSGELIRTSFKACGISNAVDGSEDTEIPVFNENRECVFGYQLLQEKHAENTQQLEEDEEQAFRMAIDEDDESDGLIGDGIEKYVFHVSETDLDED